MTFLSMTGLILAMMTQSAASHATFTPSHGHCLLQWYSHWTLSQ